LGKIAFEDSRQAAARADLIGRFVKLVTRTRKQCHVTTAPCE
jgi:hypothetical protein